MKETPELGASIELPQPYIPASSLSTFPILTSPTTPLGPSLSTTPCARPKLFSISSPHIPLSSLSTSSCRIVETSRKLFPPSPLPVLANSNSACCCRRSRAVSTIRAGFLLGSGKTCGCDWSGELLEPSDDGDGKGLKVEEFERVELGWTGPRERRDLAKSGSEASRLMANDRCQ